MFQRLILFLIFLILAVGSLSWIQAATAADAAPDGSMRMYRDPQSGVVGAPSAAALQAEAARRVTADTVTAEPLVEEPVKAPAGGVKVNLRGGHRPAVVRYADPGAPVVHECVSAPGAANE